MRVLSPFSGLRNFVRSPIRGPLKPRLGMGFSMRRGITFSSPFRSMVRKQGLGIGNRNFKVW